MRLPNVPLKYAPTSERERNRTLELADNQNRKVTDDIDLSGNRLILTSPDGARWSVTVDNTGTISTTSL